MNIMQLFYGPCRTHAVWKSIISCCLCALWTVTAAEFAEAQPSPQSLLVGGSLGTGIYHGEFNSLQADFSLSPGFTTSLLLQYNLTQAIAVGASLGYSSLPYSITSFARGKYASNFFGPVGGTTYPGTSIAITDQNDITISQLQLFGKLYLPHLLWDKYTPYGIAGIGLINFTPTNDDGETLPTDLTGTYSTTALIVPLGGGLEYKITDKLTGWAEMVYHRTFTDYLDGYAHYIDYETSSISSGPGTQPTQNDHFTTLRVGISYKVYEYKPEPEPEPEPPSSPLASGDTPPPSEKPVSQPPQEREPTPEEPASRPEREEPGRHPPQEQPVRSKSNDAYRLDSNATDSDLDNLSDEDEINTYGTDPYSRDSDNDGLSDGEEAVLYNTDPLAADTDGDLLSDLSEIRRLGTNARAVDTDRDLLTDNEELSRTGTNPLDPDTDRDGLVDGADDCPTLPGPPENNGCPEDWIREKGLAANPSHSSAPLDPLEPGERKEFSEIYFRHNSADFDFTRPETGQELTELLDFLQECEDVGVLIEGHTSGEGDPQHNMELSRMRAERVKEWLLANGVAPDKLLGTVGYGSRMPKIAEPSQGDLSPASLERIRAQNRRITAVIRKSCS